MTTKTATPKGAATIEDFIPKGDAYTTFALYCIVGFCGDWYPMRVTGAVLALVYGLVMPYLNFWRAQRIERLTVQVINAVHALKGDHAMSIHWFQSWPIAEFGNLTARQLVEQGKAQAVLDYIQSRSAGATG